MTHLTLGVSFNHPIDLLPSSLTFLVLSRNLKQPINLLPRGLTHLTIYPNNFDDYIETIPNFITHLFLRGVVSSFTVFYVFFLRGGYFMDGLG